MAFPGCRRSGPFPGMALSSVTVIFEENVNIYFARQLVSERLNTALESIPRISAVRS